MATFREKKHCSTGGYLDIGQLLIIYDGESWLTDRLQWLIVFGCSPGDETGADILRWHEHMESQSDCPDGGNRHSWQCDS